MKNETNKQKYIINNLEKDMIYILLIYLCMIVFSMVMFIPNYLYNIVIFIFGLLFFAAGFHTATRDDSMIFDLIFLFSHGGSGYGVMIYSMLSERITLGKLTDLGGNLKLYITLTVAVLIITFIATIIYNISKSLKKYKYNKVILLLLYAIVLVLIGFIPIINF